MINFKLGNIEIKENGEPIFFPDIGTFFDNDISKAEKMIRDLAKSGCKFIKGEILHSDEICLDTETIEKYYCYDGNIKEEKYKELVKRKVVSIESYEKLFKLAKDLNMEFLVSVYDFEGADYAKKWGACAIKIATSNITHIPLIRYVASLDLPIIIDTGRSNWDEIARAVQVVKETGNCKFIVEHSPSAPPAPVEKQNLNMMLSLKRAFDVHPGLSDHHHGEEMMFAAVAMGVQILEKGVCFDDNKDDQDVYHAIPIAKVADTLQKCKNVYRAQGNGTRFLKDSEKKTTDRMCLVAKMDLKIGDTITLDNVKFAFPELGIPAYEWDNVENKEIIKNIPKNSVIGWSDVSLFTK